MNMEENFRNIRALLLDSWNQGSIQTQGTSVYSGEKGRTYGLLTHRVTSPEECLETGQ